mgnify:CR=1 FL=1|jgi:hypothetical protein|tara:strand:+ start:792 stop:950 length:159 start_codon:yes stop_codon:yes gene_type:complete
MMTWVVALVSFSIGAVVGVVGVAVVTAFSEGLIPARVRNWSFFSRGEKDGNG